MTKKLIILTLMAATFAGCSDGQNQEQIFSAGKNPIYYGKADTSTSHNAVVMLAKKANFSALVR